MLISLNWLRDYVDIPVGPEQLAEDLTMLGLNVEGVEHRPNPFAALRIGRVLSADKHPNADKLSVCKVDIGEVVPRDIVCGAPNVRSGLEVVVIPAGSSLPDGTPIKKGKIRGAVSEGMICSAVEIGLGQDAAGIIELDLAAKPGTPLSEHHGEEDWVLDIEVTPNRPDQLGILGIAREVAARYDLPLRLPDVELAPGQTADQPPVPLAIEDPAGCPRYIARRLRGVTVQASPDWLCRRLEAVGLRPINNVVDVTNYVLFETGHPLHAFDASKLAGGAVRVRRARRGERLLTLDESELELDPSDLLIADAEAGIALAGVMGGEGSKVEDTSDELILESAVFDPRSIRATRRRHDLSTDSSYRFERGASFEMAAFASARATRLLVELGGAVAAQEPTEANAGAPAPIHIDLRLAKVNGLMGTALQRDRVAALLERFELVCEARGEDLRVRVPEFRQDLRLEVDLIEEIARLYGYDELPSENRVRNTLHARLGDDERAADRVHGALTGAGCQEVLTSSFMDERHLDDMGLDASDARRRLVTVLNPLVSFNSQLRSSLLPGMLDVLKTNFHRGQEELRLYQLGRVYLEHEDEPLPAEPTQLAVLLTGHMLPPHWSQPSEPLQLADLKGVAARLGAVIAADPRFDYEAADPYLVPGMSFRLLDGERVIGQGGLLRPQLLRELKQKREVYLLELFHPLGQAAQAHYAPLPAYPPTRRDLALLVPDAVPWAEVEACIRGAKTKWLESCELFDVYRGKGVPPGNASCAVRLSFRSREGTLTDKQVDRQLRRVLDQLNKSLRVELRS